MIRSDTTENRSGPILVIKLGALGDFVQALGPMAAIRAQHTKERIILLTTRPYVAFAEASGYVDQVWLDTRPRFFELNKWIGLRRVLRNARFQRIYDLQTSDRSSFYYHLFFPKKPPPWSGIARGCAHLHDNPNRNTMHTVERQREQLAIAGVRMSGYDDIAGMDLSWATADISSFDLPNSFALLVPGGAAHRPAKRWPETHYAKLAEHFQDQGVTPVLVGGEEEKSLLDRIAKEVSSSVNLAGRTDLLQLAELGRGAQFAVGNDTGPMHLIAAVGCKAVVLYSHDSDPALCGQRGRNVQILRRPSLAELEIDEVITTLSG